MRDSAIVKVTAILGLTALEITNMLTMRIDGALLLFIGGLIGGIAGYEFGKRR